MADPPILQKLSNIDGVERVNWIPATMPDPGNPNERKRNAIEVVPEKEEREFMSSLLSKIEDMAEDYEFNIDESVLYDDIIELRGPER
jgi:hypothetical protein